MSKADNNDTSVPVEALDTIDAADLQDHMNQPVTMTIDTTLYGFVTLMALIQRESDNAAGQGKMLDAIELLALIGRIEDANEDVLDAYNEVSDYINEDRVKGGDISISVLPDTE